MSDCCLTASDKDSKQLRRGGLDAVGALPFVCDGGSRAYFRWVIGAIRFSFSILKAIVYKCRSSRIASTAPGGDSPYPSPHPSASTLFLKLCSNISMTTFEIVDIIAGTSQLYSGEYNFLVIKSNVANRWEWERVSFSIPGGATTGTRDVL